MKRIAKFHKVSKERFTADWVDTFAQSKEEAERVYEAIRLPKRATAGSAGYDFFAPAEFTLKPGETVKIPTGIRVEMQPEWVLKCYPRSGLGFKYRLQLNNTVGIIDSDYFYSDNEGHIFAKITNDSNEDKTLTIPADTGFMRESLWSMELLWMTMQQKSVTADLEVPQSNLSQSSLIKTVTECLKSRNEEEEMFFSLRSAFSLI